MPYPIPAHRISELIAHDFPALAAFNRADELIRQSGIEYNQDIGGPMRFIMVALIHRRFPEHGDYMQLVALRPLLSNEEFLSCLDVLLAKIPNG